MADVFISYARTEREKAERIRDLLEEAGLSTFFDVQGLDGGDVFPDVLDREVKSAGCVLGLWSPYALSRPWIRTECLIGKDRGVLVPAAIEPIDPMRDIPIAFYGVQHIDLTGFSGDPASDEWRLLMRAVARTLKRPDLAQQESGRSAKAAFAATASSRRRPRTGWLVAAVVLLATTLAGVAWMVDPFGWKKPAPTSELATPDASGDQPGASPAGAAGAETAACPPVVATVYFEWQSSNITAVNQEMLTEAVRTATRDCIVERITATGHEDMSAPPDLAVARSQQRAQNVVNFLKRTGLAHSLFHVEAKGNTELPVPTDPGVKEPLNRRVTVEFARWPGQETESFDSQTLRMALVEALPRLIGGKKLADRELDHRALIAGLREVAGPEYIESLATDLGDFALIAGWMHEEGLGYDPASPLRASRFFRASCEAREATGCAAYARLVGRGVAGLDVAEARRVLDAACKAGVSEACATR
jgi:outer membrane protein OmpA-like peptidoglycan-associated protein